MGFCRPFRSHRALFLWTLSLGGLALAPGCPGEPDGPTTGLSSAVISGALEVPPVVSSGSGEATVNVSDALDFITVNATTRGLINERVTAAHIHAGLPGENGPVIFPLYDREADGEFTGVIDRRLTVDDFQVEQSAIPSFDEALRAVLEGRTYINFHTVDNPEGEMRGHIGRAVFAANINGNHIVPPLDTPARGNANVVLGPLQNEMEVVLALVNLNVISVTQISIHVGQPGTVGPEIFRLYSAAVDPIFDPSQVFILTPDDVIPQPNFDIIVFDDAVRTLLTEGLYILVRTEENPEGEVRGRIFIDNTLNVPR